MKTTLRHDPFQDRMLIETERTPRVDDAPELFVASCQSLITFNGIIGPERQGIEDRETTFSRRESAFPGVNHYWVATDRNQAGGGLGGMPHFVQEGVSAPHRGSKIKELRDQWRKIWRKK